MPPCPRCGSPRCKKDGSPRGRQRYRCHGCGRTFTARTATPFGGYRWPRAVIVLAVRLYCQFRLSAANVRDLLAERHVDVSARTILSWVQIFGPLIAGAVRRHARPVGRHWCCDETYLRVGGAWAYLYRAVDEHGQVVDGLLRARRDLASARAFLGQAIARRGRISSAVITDKHRAYGRAIREQAPGALHVATGLHRAGGPTTKPIERSHVPIKDRVRPMRGLQRLATGQRALEGIEAAQSIRRGDVQRPGPARESAPAPAAATRAREVVETFTWLAKGLRRAA
jgi:transposase-like protein